jgi:hypothetical protein
VDIQELENLEAASVKLLDQNGNLVGQPQHKVNGIYLLEGFAPEYGKEYRVEVSHNGYDPAWATDMVPKQVPIIDYSVRDIPNPMLGTTDKEITIQFADPVNEQNYYMIEAFGHYYYEDSFNNIYQEWTEQLMVSSTDPMVTSQLNSGETRYYGQAIVVDDSRIDGKTYGFRIIIDGYTFEGNDVDITLTLSNMGLSAYRYFTSLDKYNRVRYDPFATPVQVFSNVEGGHGIFAGSSSSSIVITP